MPGHPNWRQIGGDEFDFISSSSGCVCGEVPRFLLTDATRGCNIFWTAKWHVSGRAGCLEIGLRRPIRLRRYKLRSANDKPRRDPRAWTLYAVDAHGGLHLLHRHRQRGSPWECDRWAWRDFDVARPNESSHRFLLRFEANCGEPNLQLGQIALIEEVTPDDPTRALAAPMEMRATVGLPVVEMVPVPIVEGQWMRREAEEQDQQEGEGEGDVMHGVVLRDADIASLVNPRPLRGVVAACGDVGSTAGGGNSAASGGDGGGGGGGGGGGAAPCVYGRRVGVSDEG